MRWSRWYGTALALALLTAACGVTEPRPEFSEAFVIHVDSARIQAPVHDSGLAKVRVGGEVGPNGRYYFDEARVERIDAGARVTMYGGVYSLDEGGFGDIVGHFPVHLDEVVEVGPIGRTPFAIRVVRDETGATIELDVLLLAFNPTRTDRRHHPIVKVNSESSSLDSSARTRTTTVHGRASENSTRAV